MATREILELLKRQGIDPDEIKRCLSTYCRKPAPGEGLAPAAVTLEGRLRAVLRDERTLAAVLNAIKPALE